jgi:hypothetical protein
MNNKSHHVYYTPMSKKAEKEKENKLDDSEFPSLTKSTTSTSIVANANAIANSIAKPILNFLEAAKKPPAPEEESMVHSENKSDSENENENENDTKNEPVIFKKGLSFD